jgi:hypothetical protein
VKSVMSVTFLPCLACLTNFKLGKSVRGETAPGHGSGRNITDITDITDEVFNLRLLL